MIPDGSTSRLAVAGKAVTANSNMAVAAADPGAPMSFAVDGKVSTIKVPGDVDTK